MRNVSNKHCRGNQTTHFCSLTSFPKNRAVYGVMWKNIVERGWPQMTIRRLHIPCWMPKTTNTLLEYVILVASHMQQWFHEGASVLYYTYFDCFS